MNHELVAAMALASVMADKHENERFICKTCDKPRYMGYTRKPDSELCTCHDQANRPLYDNTGAITAPNDGELYMRDVRKQLKK